MVKKHFLCVMVCGWVMFVAGCEHIQEPWVRNRDQLAQERSRNEAAQMELRNRFLEVQIDR